MSFQITTKPFGEALPDGRAPLTEYRLENSYTGEFATVVPGYGAALCQLVLRQAETLVAVIQGPDSTEALLADQTYAGALLYPFPGRTRQGQYTFAGQTYALPTNETSRGHALHGLVFDKPFVVVGQAVIEQSASLMLRYDYSGHEPGYPFPFSLTVFYQLLSLYGGDLPSQLILSYSAKNTGLTAAPAGFGWHPYLSMNNLSLDEMHLQLPTQTAIVLGDDMIPTGTAMFGSMAPDGTSPASFSLKNQALDTPFLIDNQPNAIIAETVLSHPATGYRLVVGQQTGPGLLNHLVVFTPPERDRIAIEPQTANADAFNNGDGLVILQPGDALSGMIWVSLG